MFSKIMRKIFGYQKYVQIEFDWIISKDGRDIARLHEGIASDIFWHDATLTPIEPILEGADLYDDDFWADCDYEVRHATLGISPPYMIIRARGEGKRVAVRGLPGRLPKAEIDAPCSGDKQGARYHA
jgi:hypothetical protein